MKKYLYITFLLISLVSCEKELDFRYHEIEPQIVIEGILTEDEFSVSITHTTPMNEKIEDIKLTGAKVVLTDMTTSEQFEVNSDSDGLYHQDIKGIPYHYYSLSVAKDDKIYESECLMRPSSQILDMQFQWIKMPYDYVAVLQISFLDFDTPDDCYWLKVYRNDEPYAWIISDDRSAVNGVITEVIMTSRKNLDEEDDKDKLEDGDEIKVSINCISREMYDYLIALENDSNGTEMFTGDFCLGYFLASGSSSKTIFFQSDKIGQYE